jgi:YD repeat-containing protein
VASSYEALGLPTLITGWDGTSTDLKYDAFGRLTETWAPHWSLPGTRLLAQRVTYDAAPRSPVQKVKVESFGGADVVVSWVYLDGFGSPVLSINQADPTARG